MKIALFADVDNFKLTAAELSSIISRVSVRGEIVFGKLYNYSDRRNADLAEIIKTNGFDAISSPSGKKSRKSVIDQRLIVDAVRYSVKNQTITGVVLVVGDGDIVPLISMLKAEGEYVIGCFNSPNEANEKMCNEVIRLVRANPVAVKKKSAQKISYINQNARPSSNTGPKSAPRQTVQQNIAAKSQMQQMPMRPQMPPHQYGNQQYQHMYMQGQYMPPPPPYQYAPQPVPQQQMPLPPQRPPQPQPRQQVQKPVEPAATDKDYQEVLRIEEEHNRLKHQKNQEELEVLKLEKDANKLLDIKNKKRELAEKLEDFAKRTSALNFDSNEDVELKQQLLADINDCLQNNDFDQTGISAEDQATMKEIRDLVASLKETVIMSLED